MKNPELTVGNLADRHKTAYIGSIDNNGFPNVKAMLAPRKREGIRVFYFTTNAETMRVKQYTRNSKACIYFCDRHFFKGAMLKGNMEILTDMESKEMMWREEDSMYYPKGIADPDYCVLKFTAFSGRYYSNSKSEDFEVK